MRYPVSILRLSVFMFFIFGGIASAHAMQIFASLPGGKIITLDVESSDSIEDVKTKISDMEDIDPEDQILSFGGTELEDGRTLSDYNIKKEAVLVLTVKATPGEEGSLDSESKSAVTLIENELGADLRYQMGESKTMLQGASTRLLSGALQPNKGLYLTNFFASNNGSAAHAFANFFAADAGDLYHTIVSGDFEIEGNSEGTFTGRFDMRAAIERHFSERSALALYMSVDGSQSHIDGTYKGHATRVGGGLGIYGVSRLTQKITIGAFGSVGLDYNRFDLKADSIAIETEEVSARYLAGATLSGRGNWDGFSIIPQLSVVSGTSDLDKVPFDTLDGSTTGKIDVSGVTLTRIALEPEMRFAMPWGERDETLNAKYGFVGARAICEMTHEGSGSSDCGAGANVGIKYNFANGAGLVAAKVAYEFVGDLERTSATLSLARRF
ncbi:ubiquitin-like protein [Pseudovibrio sp. SPO723]|uniref:ubiquitin-like protein n=1 Tax=Nesiotobacter zosterae TaxID=392721 RepID=UPI0029C37FD6|nr:ubiquitin-like protein [Pseudovibrio sp. SPO723]MDX5593309.1 ubiquitin-like protein [Pseudovibrio sp. SPO723]